MFTSLEAGPPSSPAAARESAAGIAETFAAAGVNVLVTARTQADLDATSPASPSTPGESAGWPPT